MRTQYVAAVAALVLLFASQSAVYAEESQAVPDWIKQTAGWWSEGVISDDEFVSSIQYLISEDIIQIPPQDDLQDGAQDPSMVPDWIKQTAGWWSEGVISDDEFVAALQYLITINVIVIDSPIASDQDPQLSKLQEDLQACSEIKNAYNRINCQDAASHAITVYEYKTDGEAIDAGPVTFYYKGNDFEITSNGQALLELSLLAENVGSSSNVILMCSGPAVCSYDVWNGERAFKYASTDFVSGQIALKPGDAREFTMLFGPNIGYGGTTFEYDPSKEYTFRIQEPWGSASIPLVLE